MSEKKPRARVVLAPLAAAALVGAAAVVIGIVGWLAFVFLMVLGR